MTTDHAVPIRHGMIVAFVFRGRTMRGVVEGFPYCKACAESTKCDHHPDTITVRVQTRTAKTLRRREVPLVNLRLP